MTMADTARAETREWLEETVVLQAAQIKDLEADRTAYQQRWHRAQSAMAVQAEQIAAVRDVWEKYRDETDGTMPWRLVRDMDRAIFGAVTA